MATDIRKLLETKLKTTMNEGTVNYFSVPHGFGFIRSKESREDIFVHFSNLIDSIKDNDKVLFDVAQGLKGLIAVKVRLA